MKTLLNNVVVGFYLISWLCCISGDTYFFKLLFKCICEWLVPEILSISSQEADMSNFSD